MDLFAMPVAGMIFVLLVILITRGFKLLEPLAKRLGGAAGPPHMDGADSLGTGEEVVQLRRVVEDLQTEVLRLSEQQQFMERLLEDRSAAQPVGEKD